MPFTHAFTSSNLVQVTKLEFNEVDLRFLFCKEGNVYGTKKQLGETIFTFKKAWKFAKNQSKSLIGYFISSLGLCLISALVPLLSAKALLYLTAGNWNPLLYIALIIFGVEISRNVCRFFSQRFSQIFFKETLLQLQYVMAIEILKLETEEMDHHSSGTFVERMSKDTSD